MLPVVAWLMAVCITLVNAALSVIVWSAGVTTSTGSPPDSWAASAARVIAGAVFFPAGSSKAAPNWIRAYLICSEAWKRCSSLVKMSGLAKW